MWAAGSIHRATHERGIRVFILTHEDAATQNLFEMVERFHEHCPPEQKQRTATANAQGAELRRARLGLQDRHGGHQGGRALVDHPALPRLRGGVLAARRDACGRRAAGGARHPGHRDHPGEHGERARQLLSPDLARRRNRRQRLHRDLRAVVLAGGIPKARRAASSHRGGARVSRPLRPRRRADRLAARQDRRAQGRGAVQAGISGERGGGVPAVRPRQLHSAGAGREGAQGDLRGERAAGDRVRSGLDGRGSPRDGVAARPPGREGREPHAGSTPWRRRAGSSR